MIKLIHIARFLLAPCAVAAVMLSSPARATESVPAVTCDQPAFLVLDGQSTRPREVASAARALGRQLGTVPLFNVAPTAVHEGDFSNGVIVVLPLACPERADGVENRRAWRRMLALTENTPDRRAVVFAADPAHAQPSPVTEDCRRDAWLGFKGWVSNPDRYFMMLRQLGQSGVLNRFGATRVIVMSRPGIVVRQIGAPFEQGEYFELLRFPCAERIEALWSSEEFKQLAELRRGSVTVRAATFEAR